MKFRIEFNVDFRDEWGNFKFAEERFHVVDAVSAEDARTVLFDKWESTPHSVHILKTGEVTG